MDHLRKDSASLSTLCEWCYGIGNNRCGRCHAVYYCCREHQMQHWPIHKTVCKGSLTPVIPVSIGTSQPSTSTLTYPSFGNWDQSNVQMPCSPNEEINQLAISSNMYNSNNCNNIPEKPAEFHIPDDDEIFSSISSELLSSDNNFWGLINASDTQNISDFSLFLGKDSDQIMTKEQGETFNSFAPNIDQNSPVIGDNIEKMQCAPLNDICSNVIHDLNTYGICVFDKFIGLNYGSLILQEVKNLYLKGIFTKGELVNLGPYTCKESIRSDVTTWVDGTESDCKHIGNLIKKLDVVVTTCNKMPIKGLLSKYKLHRRTKAMIACYPGDGTYYKKHIDNPHKDGRCITCIYYLNQNWDTKVHGGLLRMFPSSHDSQVANIEPIFDRMIFFWSDKRNPHEVLPSFATRFAITVWYFDADERDQALKMSRERALKKSRNTPIL